jgi:16S rRNA (uracil1498-N3)-methyltransferase
MPRFHLPAAAWPAALLEGDEARHLAQVLRIKPGATVTVFDGAGRHATATVLTVSRNRVALAIGEPAMPRILRPAITLAQAVPKGKNMDLIVQKAVELGVARIQPLITRHTIVQPGEGKAEKWRRTALEACKQCGQDLLPEIAEPTALESWLGAIRRGPDPPPAACPDQPAAPPATAPLRLIASLAAGARPFREVLRAHPLTAAATLLIGPEGDFTAGETAAALGAGFSPVSLGPVVLRVETASLYGLSALRYEFGGGD